LCNAFHVHPSPFLIW